MDDVETVRLASTMKDEAVRVARLILEQSPAIAIDIRDTLPQITREEVDERFPLVAAEDLRSATDAPQFRRHRRLAELYLALDEALDPPKAERGTRPT